MVDDLFQPFHLFMEAGEKSEVTEAAIRDKLAQMKVRIFNSFGRNIFVLQKFC